LTFSTKIVAQACPDDIISGDREAVGDSVPSGAEIGYSGGWNVVLDSSCLVLEDNDPEVPPAESAMSERKVVSFGLERSDSITHIKNYKLFASHYN
jgi:hypothetical protein